MPLILQHVILLCILIVLCYVKCSDSDSIILGNLEINNYTLIYPKFYYGREKRQITSTKQQTINRKHLHHITVKFDADNKHYELDLQLNQQLLTKNYFIHLQANGSVITKHPTIEDVTICHYIGKIKDVNNSWVAISTCNDSISGVIFDGNEMLVLENSLNGTGNNTQHVLIKNTDIVKMNERNEYYNNDFFRRKRSTSTINYIAEPFSSDKNAKYVEMLIVIDRSKFRDFRENLDLVRKHCKDITNVVNSMYMPLGIYVALVGIVVWNEKNEMIISRDSQITLTNFLEYRKRKLLQNFRHDSAQFLTFEEFDNAVVGKAFKEGMCSFNYSGGVASEKNAIAGLAAWTIAHEMGHTFGMEHDDPYYQECKCPEKKCIMSASSNNNLVTTWSSCSLDYLRKFFARGSGACLRNKPEFLLNTSSCGNGFLEPGEECDCGLQNNCINNHCCDWSTCKLKRNATCGSGECCDLMTCNFKSIGSNCRSEDGECDLPEYCSGNSEFCPKNVFKLDSLSCRNGAAYCYEGKCKSQQDQCNVLWGPIARAGSEQCYENNKFGTYYANCGYNRFNDSYIKCKQNNELCGRLLCHLNNDENFKAKLLYGNAATQRHSSFQVYDRHSNSIAKLSTIYCYSASIDEGADLMDSGLVPNGAKCGEEKMCVNQECISVDKFRFGGKSCLYNCSGNGVCNNLGHCHCDYGYSPPYCDTPGHGGSEHSGPMANPAALRNIAIAMYIVFLGIIPFIAILCFVNYTIKRNLQLSGKEQSLVHSFCDRFLCCANVKNIFNTSSSNIYQNVSDMKNNTKNKSTDNSKTFEINHYGERSTTNISLMGKLEDPIYENISTTAKTKGSIINSLRNTKLSFGNFKNLKVDVNLFKTKTNESEEPKASETNDSDFIYEEINSASTSSPSKVTNSFFDKTKKMSLKNFKDLKVHIPIFKINLNNDVQEVKTSETECTEFDYNKIDLDTPSSSEMTKTKRPSLKNIKNLKVNINLFRKAENQSTPEPKTTETMCSEFDYDVKPVSVKNLRNQFERS